MFIEVHVIQNYALSNLNRDDTGAPKSCIFGGTRRARISSQCLKRSVRTYVRERKLVPSEHLAYRTRRLHHELAKRLEAEGLDGEKARAVAVKAIDLLDLKLKNDRTEYLLMLGEREVQRLAELCRDNIEELQSEESAKKEKKGKKSTQSELSKQFLQVLDGGDAVDIALFGRMVATHPEKNVDAAVQMAHAISTNAVANEFDFYSAVDDLQEHEDDEGAGAGMLGTILYNSSCYYRYANLDLNQLRENLPGRPDLAIPAARAFLEGMVHAVPTGKRTNSAPQNPPSLVMMVVRDAGLWSLANAFVRPIPGQWGDLIELSAKRMLEHWNELVGMYGGDGIRYASVSTYLSAERIGLDSAVGVSIQPQVSRLIDGVIDEISHAD